MPTTHIYCVRLVPREGYAGDIEAVASTSALPTIRVQAASAEAACATAARCTDGMAVHSVERADGEAAPVKPQRSRATRAAAADAAVAALLAVCMAMGIVHWATSDDSYPPPQDLPADYLQPGKPPGQEAYT